MAAWNKTTITICGGSQLAKCIAALATSRGLFDMEILILDGGDKQSDTKISIVEDDNGEKKSVASVHLPTVVDNAKECIPKSSVVILVLEPPDHEQYLKAIKDYIEKGTVIIALPSTPCFELLCGDILGDNLQLCNIVSCNDVPWDVCSVGDDKTQIEMTNMRSRLICSLLSRARPKRPPFFSLQVIFGLKPQIVMTRSWLEQALVCEYMSVVKLVTVYGAWKHADAKPVEQILSIYADISEYTTEMIEKVGDEIMKISRALMTHLPRCDFKQCLPLLEILEFVFPNFGLDAVLKISDAFKSQEFFSKQKLHMVKNDDGLYTPDYASLCVDVECVLVPLFGLARLVEATTPTMAAVIEWYQQQCHKEYVINGELTGKDIPATRCPQRFNIVDMDSLLMYR